MKKFIICLCFIISTVSLISCNKGTVPNELIIEVSQSTKFSQDEIDNAIKCVKNNFNLPASTLTKIWYDEEKNHVLVDSNCLTYYILQSKRFKKQIPNVCIDYVVFCKPYYNDVRKNYNLMNKVIWREHILWLLTITQRK